MEDIAVYSPITWISWLLSLPVRLFTVAVVWYKGPYDPEKDMCPGCGFRGNKGTDNKVCRVQTRPVMSVEKLALWHSCFRCSAEYWTNCVIAASKWYREPQPPLTK